MSSRTVLFESTAQELEKQELEVVHLRPFVYERPLHELTQHYVILFRVLPDCH